MTVSSAFCQQLITVDDYIETYKDIAIGQMKEYHIPASITLAQGILESNCGNSPLAAEANNHFGIKCHKEWTGKTFYQDDDEKEECFRKYSSAEESYKDHSSFLVTRERYWSLFDLKADDYKGWAYGLKQAGYATNPKYPELLIKIIEENKLYLFDKGIQQSAVGSQQLAVSGQQSGKAINKANASPTANKKSKTHDSNNSNSKLSTQNSTLTSGPPATFDLVGIGGDNRKIFENNGVKFIYAREGDDCMLIAAEFQIYTWQVYHYNEMSKEEELQPGQKIYLEKKRARADFDYHKVKEGEDLRTISQDYGIRLNSLCKLNKLSIAYRAISGETLILR
jgi:flagellum-specific peptidoglycan hydrolase FlgJ